MDAAENAPEPAYHGEAKCKCNHCSGHIEFPIENAGAEIKCPHCDMDTLLYVPAPTEPGPKPYIIAPQIPAAGLTPAQTIHRHAENLSGLAIWCFAFGCIPLLIGIVAAVSNPADAAEDFALGCGIAGAFWGNGMWLYLVAQILHIRANTHK